MTDRFTSPLRRFGTRPVLALAAAGLLAAGGAVGAVVVAETRPEVAMAPAAPVAIRSLSEGIVTVRGRVVETFGSRFVLADATGRALIDTGHEGEDTPPVSVGQQVTVQGRFDHGFVRAAFLVGADGKVRALDAGEGRHHGRRGHDHDDHERGDVERDDDGATQPAPGTGAAPSVAPVPTTPPTPVAPRA